MKQIQFDLAMDLSISAFPSTRYQGSKLKIAEWIWENVKNIQFETILDAFGGTGCVSYLFKTKNKQVIYNDILFFNYLIGKALIENSSTYLLDNEIDEILKRKEDVDYPTIIEDNFADIYYTHDENKWLDVVAYNIYLMKDNYKKSIAYFALFQSCIIKRPFNLFHRKNLYIRTADVKRNFGNAATWNIPFDICFKKFAAEANRAIFDNGKKNRAINKDVFDIKENCDLVYIDTPYISKKGATVDYYDFYHFLEGLVDYINWPERIDIKSKHKRLTPIKNIWNDKNKIASAFDMLFKKYRDSYIVVSYRADGIPSVEELEQMLSTYKTEVVEIIKKDYKYVLSNNKSHEILLIGK